MDRRAGQVELAKTDNGRVVIASWPRLLSVKMLALYLSVAEQTIRNRADGIPGRVYLGRSVRWDRDIVDLWLADVGPGGDLFRKPHDDAQASPPSSLIKSSEWS